MIDLPIMQEAQQELNDMSHKKHDEGARGNKEQDCPNSDDNAEILDPVVTPQSGGHGGTLPPPPPKNP